MKRRSFLKTGSLLSLPVIVGGIPVSSFSRSRFTQLLEGEGDRVLVIIQLNGGNDGLNTLIPLDQYDHLSQWRSSVLIPESSIIKVEENNGFHPAMESLYPLYEEGKMNIIQGVGYPDQNRSHFRSTDIWHTASDASEFLNSGWLGRYYYEDHPLYPENYPNDKQTDPLAITVGFQVSETCQGPVSNYSIAINGEDSLQPIDETEEGVEDGSCYAREVRFIRETIKQLNAYADVVGSAFEVGTNMGEYNDNNPLARQLRLVAKLISGGLKTKVYVVSLGGFDTHANQVDIGDAREGEHATLLLQLSEAIAAFQSDLEKQDLSERVIGMTYSEFGRRIRSNASLGTDHGSAAPLFLFGNCVNDGIIGENPDISGEIGVQDGVPMQYDFRSVYASVLIDWFGVEEGAIRSYLFEEFQHLPIIYGCQSTSTDLNMQEEWGQLSVFPNPSGDYLQFSKDHHFGKVTISIFNHLGGRVLHQHNYSMEKKLDIRFLVAGTYFLRIAKDQYVFTKKIIKI